MGCGDAPKALRAGSEIARLNGLSKPETTANDWAAVLNERVVNAITEVHKAVLAEAMDAQRHQDKVRIGEVESLRGRVAELEDMLEKSQADLATCQSVNLILADERDRWKAEAERWRNLKEKP